MNIARTSVFNSPVEIGLRSLCILVELDPHKLDLQRLVLLDYLLVNSADVEGGPDSLHPAVPHRAEEVLVRRAILEPGLSMYARRGLVEMSMNSEGFMYSACDRGACFLDTLKSGYVVTMRARACWIAESFGSLTTTTIKGFVGTQLDRWAGQFTGPTELGADS